MNDPIRNSALAGKVVLWDETARDGAQAKTLLSFDQRLQLAHLFGGLFPGRGPEHVNYCVGFPAVCREEAELVYRFSQEVDCVSFSAACGVRARDVAEALASVRGSTLGRIFVIGPISEPFSQTLMHCSARDALARLKDCVKRIKDSAPEINIDIALADASRTSPSFLVEAIGELHPLGVATVMLPDSVGALFPSETRALFQEVIPRVGPDVVITAHCHNDYGLALANTLECYEAGATVLSSSVLGLGERVGIAATEQLVFAIDHLKGRRGTDPWWVKPQLELLPVIARLVSQWTGTPLKITDPIVGPGVNSISTGTPFSDPHLFQPFDPEALLGIAPQVHLTHLASTSVLRAVLQSMNIELPPDRLRSTLEWVKRSAFEQNEAKLDPLLLRDFIARELAQTEGEGPSR